MPPIKTKTKLEDVLETARREGFHTAKVGLFYFVLEKNPGNAIACVSEEDGGCLIEPYQGTETHEKLNKFFDKYRRG